MNDGKFILCLLLIITMWGVLFRGEPDVVDGLTHWLMSTPCDQISPKIEGA
jgi:hypothetical protein